jgi:Zn-dependent protease with chaperone function
MTNSDRPVVVVPSQARMRLPGISPRAYEHPADRGALATLRAVPGFGTVAKAVAGAFSERGERLLTLGSAIRVGPRQYPKLHEIREECAAILDVPPPELYVTRSAEFNASTLGLNTPFIVLTTALVSEMDEESLRFVIGHEMGHVLSGHALYRTMLMRLLGMVNGMSWLPGGYWGLRAVIAALQEWFRKAELSADRAGLLCGQDPAAALRAHLLTAGAVDTHEVDTGEFLRQARDYESAGDVRDSVLKLMNVAELSHPLEVVRAAELQQWAASAEYREILAGDYPRRDADPATTTWGADVKSAAKSYKDSVVESTDPLARVFTDMGGAITDAAGKMWQRLRPGSPEAPDSPDSAADSAADDGPQP